MHEAMLRTMRPAMLGFAAALGSTAAPLAADTLEQLDALSDIAVDEESGIAFAQQQAARGEWLEAIATLERVLAENPKSRGGRLLQVLYLCKVDDRTGAAVAMTKLKEKHYDDAALAEVRAQCGFAGGD